MGVLFLGKKNDPHCDAALAFVRANFERVEAFNGEWGEPLPPLQGWRGDYIISYLSRWVVPRWLLDRAAKAAINFHPASPEYPGIGCVNFALYDGASEYGATCHHMHPRVDTGPIIAVKRFPVFASDDVASLLARTYAFQLALFYEVAALMAQGEPLPSSSEKWGREPFTRREFNELGLLRPGMSHEEIARRTRATKFGQWGPRCADAA